MGEIATWSAVKTKVGLGKDSNECPTKAELLALSPTGTGENYVGLEISNASSYGNNETVQLSDIHKVTYRYAFTVVDTVLNFPALGGYSTPRWFGLGTTKQKQIDGVAIGDTISVGYTQSAYPDWIVYDEGYKASENTTLNQRSASLTFTQNESGKQITVQFTQDAGVETWEYTFTSKNNSLVFNAIGGKGTPTELTITSNKQKYINGKAVGSPVNIDYSRPSLPSWLSVETGYYEALENKSESSRSYTDILTQAESGKKLTPVLSQAAGVKTYGTPTVYLGSIADIPASGGTAATPTYTYSQLWGWNGKTNDGGTISSGASVVWSENISGSNLGTTAKARTKLGSRTLTVTLNGKSGNASIDIYQAENKITNVTQGTWVVSISANPSTFTEQGGTSQISASARASRTNHWSSGATSAASDATGTPTLSIPTASTGFSLSGTTLTVAENTTANQRSVVVRATMDTVYKEVTVTQSAYLVEWQYTFTASPTTLSFDALGIAKSITITSYREKYINGSLVEGSRENVSYIHATSTEHIGTVLGTSISMQENQTTSTRSGQVSYEQNGSNKVIRITCNQAAGTVSTRDVLEVVDNFGDSPAVGGSIFGLVKSGYYDVINGKDSTWHNVTPTLKSKSSYITNVEITKASGEGYNIGITLSENTSESSRRASLTLTYGSKEVDMATTQAGASVAWSYELKVNNGTQDLNQQVPAKPSGTYSFTISSKRYKIVNGSVTSQSEDTTWTTSIPGSPSWIHVEEQSNTLIVTVDENTTTSQRSADIVIFQTGSSDTSITLTVEQQAASITWNYTFNIFQPSSKVLNVPAKMIDPDTIVVNSYRTKVINGTQTSTKEFVEVTIDPIEESWLEVTKNSNDQTQAELFVTCLENKVSSIRSATVTIRQVGTSNLDQVDINQSAATVSYNYYIGFNGNPDVGGYSMNWEYTQFGSSHGQSIDLKCWRKPVINGIESDTEEAAEYEVIFSGVGIDSFTVTNTPLSYDPTITTVRAYPKSINGSVFDLKGTVQYRIADYPSKSAYLYLTHKPVATVKRWTFQWYDQVESVTIKNVSHDSSAGSISPITIISKCEYLLASNQSQVAYTEYIKPNEDEDTATPVSWGRLVENGQTAQNDYDYAYLVDENKEDYDRQATRTFTQPGNPSNKRLYLYVTQESPHTPEVAFDVYNSSLSASLLMGIGWRSNEGSDSLPNLSRGEYLGAHGSNKSNIQVVYHAQPITTSQKWLPAAPSLKEFSYDGLPIALNGTDRYYNISEFQYGSSSASELFKVTVDNIDYDPTYGGSLTLQWEARLSNNKPTNGMYVGMIVLTPVRGNLPTIYVRLYYQSPSVKPSV
nr:MAG TPA: cellulase [Caudoviricetes sp.]